MTLSQMELKQLCQVAEKAARAAGEYIQSRVGDHYEQRTKAGGHSMASQVVTEVDLQAQKIILDHLNDSIRTYDLGLLTEEAADDASRLSKSFFWCIDPMDGTLAFTEGRAGYAVSIALVSQAGDPVIGVVYLPDEKTCYTAVRGEGVQQDEQAFQRGELSGEENLQNYLDRSFADMPTFEEVKTQLAVWAKQQGVHEVQYHFGYGAVRNAIAVMHSVAGCYFKFPKPQQGGGSIWDYAATRLFFEELGFPVSDAQGRPLHLNNAETTFMNTVGVLFATQKPLADEVLRIGREFQ